ncbi:hypothetical protein BABA_14422 [Neobacillus bataviensis LMG 21833]|uniref:Uncharacterized protein n=1 Tax=Neobacillus bataviensis LMG 21833 TaxID=1117379 RepID=K6C6A8_9BACI|nr:hypothetical protein [Neobacillus bataviensis]EKN66660.1 hypothetical protein BABA_14422 [Neobacillus bataviensis LMG 21833]
MDQIKINLSTIKSYQSNLERDKSRVSDVKQSVSSIRNQISSKILSRRSIGQKLNTIAQDIHNAESQLNKLKAFMEESINQYTSAERKVDGRAAALLGINSINIEKQMAGAAAAGQKHASKDDSQWKKWRNRIVEALTNDEGGLASELLLGGFSASLVSKYYKMPKFLKDGRYLKVLNSEFYKGGEGLARRYTIENVKNGRYPNVSKLVNIDNGLKIAGKVGAAGALITGAAQVYKELTTNDNVSTKRKVINAGVKGAEVAAVAVVGAKLGAAVGTIIAPGVGTAVGAVVGAGVAAVGSYFMDKGVNLKIWGSGKQKKSTLDVIGDGVEIGVDAVGNAAKGASRWFGNLFKDKPKPVTGAG